MTLEPVNDFCLRYSKEYDYYRRVAQICAARCELELEQHGIKAIVTHRAKRPDRLKEKIAKRNADRECEYGHIGEIYEDIVDLSGVRIALYFPGQIDEVTNIINNAFHVRKTKIFPQESKQSPLSTSSGDIYNKVFSGYKAKHFRVQLIEELLPPEDRRFSGTLIEIQVASVLMHAWAEVEHDLIYKPQDDSLSEDEHTVLDQINGLVLSGEIALERLQKSGAQRYSIEESRFPSHFELAGFLIDSMKAKVDGSSAPRTIGRTDLLFDFLLTTNLDRPKNLKQHIAKINPYSADKDISEQLIDSILESKPNLREIYQKIFQVSPNRDDNQSVNTRVDAAKVSMQKFLGLVRQFDKLSRLIIAQLTGNDPYDRIPLRYVASLIYKQQLIDKQDYEFVNEVARLRGFIFSRKMLLESAHVEEVAEELARLITRLMDKANSIPELKPAIDKFVNESAVSDLT